MLFGTLKKEGNHQVVAGKVKIGEEEHEVELALPEGVRAYTKDQVKTLFIPKKDFERRVSSISETKLEEALGDDEFKAKALSTWGIDLEQGGEKGKLKDDERFAQRLAAERKVWEEKTLKPLQTELENTKGVLGKERGRGLEADILAAANEVGFQEFLTKRPMEGKAAPLVNMVKDYFGYDEESGKWLVRDGDSFAISSEPTESRTYKDVVEFMTEFAETNKSLLDDKRQRGPKAGDPKNTRPGDLASQITSLESEGKYLEADQLRAQQLEQMAR